MAPVMVLGAIVLIAGIWIASVMYLRKKRMDSYLLQQSLGERMAAAYPANAMIIQAQGGMVGETAEQARMNLTLEVMSGKNESYLTKTTWLVDITALDYMKSGNTISVKIDREDRNIVYPGAPWARYVLQ